MKEVNSESIDLTVTSPPYDNLRDYGGYIFDFEPIARELYRVTKDGGVVVWVVGDATIKGSETGTSFRQALYFKEIGFNLHDTMIYAKQNWMPLTHNRYEQAFEYMFVFSKGKPNTFNPIMIDCKRAGELKRFNYECGTTNENSAMRSGRNRIETKITKDKKIVANIFTYGVSKGGSTNDKIAFKHPAIFPEKLAHDHILSWSNENDIVLDPMFGSGTTLKMAKRLNRRYVGYEINREYCQIAEQRLEAEKILWD